MFGPTDRDADLFHVIPEVIVDGFPYLEDGRGRRAAVLWTADAVHVPEHGVEVLPREAYGWDDLVTASRDEFEIWSRLVPRVCADLGIREAAVPPQFPVFLADALRAAGVRLRVDPGLFAGRRRVKAPREPSSRRGSCTASATGSGSTSTSARTWPASVTSSSPAT